MTQSEGKKCWNSRSLTNHIQKGKLVACKFCAYHSKLCVKKMDDGKIALTPLCDSDRGNANQDQLAYWMWTGDEGKPNSKQTEEYHKSHATNKEQQEVEAQARAQ